MLDRRISNGFDERLRACSKERTKSLLEQLSELNEEELNNIKDKFTKDGVTYEIEIYPEESGYIARWEDDTDNGFGYNNRGFVNLSNTDLRYAIDKNGVAKPEDYISVISEFDRPLKKEVEKEIIRRVLTLKNKDKNIKDMKEKLYQVNIDGEDMGTFDNEQDAYRERDRLNNPNAKVIELDTNWDEEIKLPTEVTYDFYSLVDDDVNINSNDYNLDDVIADRLSDDYGYTHFGFEYDIDNENETVYVYNIEWDLSENLKESVIPELVSEFASQYGLTKKEAQKRLAHLTKEEQQKKLDLLKGVRKNNAKTEIETESLKEDTSSAFKKVNIKLPGNWVIAKYKNKYALLSAEEFEKASENPDKWFNEWFIDLFPTIKSLMFAFKKEPYYKHIFKDFNIEENLKENVETFRDDIKSYYKLYRDGQITSDEYSKKFKELKKKHQVKDSDLKKNWKNLEEDYKADDETLLHLSTGDLTEDDTIYVLVVFDKEGENGHHVLAKNPKDAFDKVYFKTPEEAKEYADKHYPDAYSVMVREEDWYDKTIGDTRASGPYSERKNGEWEDIAYKNETLKEELGAYHNEPFCEEIAAQLENGLWSGETENGTPWELDINGLSSSEFSPSFANYIAEEVAYPVRDGHLSYLDIEMVLYKSQAESYFGYDSVERFIPDLIKLGVDREDIDAWLKDSNPDAMLDIYYDYNTNFNEYDWEENENKNEFLYYTDEELAEYIHDNFEEITGEDISIIYNNSEDEDAPIYDQNGIDKTSDSIISFLKDNTEKTQREIDDFLEYLDNYLSKYYEFNESLKESYNGDIEKDLQTYCDLLEKDLRAHYPNSKDTFTFTKGGKYYKVLENGNSVHAFVDEDGNVYKPAGWKAPAKGIRARLEDIVSGKQKVDWSGGYLYSNWYRGIRESLKEEHLINDEIDDFFQSLDVNDDVYFVTEDENGNEGETFFDLQDAINYVEQPETSDTKVVAFANIAGDGFNRKSVTVYEYNNLEESLKETIDYSDEKYLLKPYWYFTKHGVGVGSIPKSVKSVWGSFEADNGTYFATSTIIPTRDLEEFEIIEKQPNIEDIPEKVRINIQNWLEESCDTREDKLTETKHDLYVNGEYIASSNRYKRAKDFKDKVTKDGYIDYAGETSLRTAGMKLDRKEIKPEDKVVVRRSK